MSSLAPHIEAFLREHLPRHRAASAHTCDSYAYSFQSLFEFAARRLRTMPSALMLELRISVQRGRPFQRNVDGISDERGRRFQAHRGRRFSLSVHDR